MSAEGRTQLKDWRNVAKGLLVGSLTGIVVGLGGFFLATIPKASGMGMVLFLLVPVCAGFGIALVTRQPNTALATTLFAVLASLAILVGFRQEGILCAVLAFPLLAFGLAVGATVGHLFRPGLMKRLGQNTSTLAFLALTPVLIFSGHRVERSNLDHTRREIVSNSIRIRASPEEVWSHLQSMNTFEVNKPWLMHFGLPVPVRCSLERKGVGAKRTCYFENGSIEETVTEWSPPYSMRLTIDRTNMPGRHWLGFESADYELQRDGNTTVVTRTTIITSHLSPIWYWRYFERLGVESEHDYILRDLARRMAR